MTSHIHTRHQKTTDSEEAKKSKGFLASLSFTSGKSLLTLLFIATVTEQNNNCGGHQVGCNFTPAFTMKMEERWKDARRLKGEDGGMRAGEMENRGMKSDL